MLEEPYRWVEAVRNRREYLEDQLEKASPVVGLTYADGLLLLTTTPGPRKLFEVYNQIAFAAVGHPADIEKLRRGVIDTAHIEGFNLSARDVSLQRLVAFGIGPLMKAAFDEIFRSPFIARVLMAGLPQPDTGKKDVFYTIDADGSFVAVGPFAAVAGTEESDRAIVRRLEAEDAEELALDQAVETALKAWGCGRLAGEREEEEEPDDKRIGDVLGQALSQGRVEAAVLDRTRPTKSKFRLLAQAELDSACAAYST